MVDLPGVGRGLLDHPYVLLSWATKPRLEAADAATAGPRGPARALGDQVGVQPLRARFMGRHDRRLERPDLRPARPSADVHLAGLAPCAMHAVSRGRVVLRSADPTVLPRIEHGLLTDPDGHDLAVLEEGVDLCRAVAATPEWRYWCGAETAPGPAVTGEALRDVDPRERGRHVPPVRHRADGPRR